MGGVNADATSLEECKDGYYKFIQTRYWKGGNSFFCYNGIKWKEMIKYLPLDTMQSQKMKFFGGDLPDDFPGEPMRDGCYKLGSTPWEKRAYEFSCWSKSHGWVQKKPPQF